KKETAMAHSPTFRTILSAFFPIPVHPSAISLPPPSDGQRSQVYSVMRGNVQLAAATGVGSHGQGQSRKTNERSEQIGTPAQLIKFDGDGSPQDRKVWGSVIRKSGVFDIAPDAIGRVELRGIGRQRLYGHIRCLHEITVYRFAGVDRNLVPKDGHRSRQPQ